MFFAERSTTKKCNGIEAFENMEKLEGVSREPIPNRSAFSCGSVTKGNVSNAGPGNGWSSITSFRSPLAAAVPSAIFNSYANLATD